jgi:hypothetical protein
MKQVFVKKTLPIFILVDILIVLLALSFSSEIIAAAPPSAPTAQSPGSVSDPGTMLSTLTPTLQWSSVSGADYYALAVSVYPYGSGNMIYNPQNVTGTTLIVNGLSQGKRYRWNIQAHGPGGWSAVSNTLYFQTQAATTIAPSAPTAQSPGSAPTITSSKNKTAPTPETGGGCGSTAPFSVTLGCLYPVLLIIHLIRRR